MKDWSKVAPAKLVVAVLSGGYFLRCAYDPYQWRFLDNVNLVIHEAGHFVFMFGGEFVTIAGGSLMQMIVPTAFVIHFYLHKQFYSAALVLFWLGQSLLNVAVYAGDALVLQLPLLGGEDSIHDWNYMLSSLGWLNLTARISNAIRFVGTLAIIAGCVFAVRESRRAETPSNAWAQEVV